MGERIILCKVLLGLPEGKGSLERPSRKWEDNIKMDLQGAECRDMDWIETAHDKDGGWALVVALMRLRVT
jgi:hypothetical protein